MTSHVKKPETDDIEEEEEPPEDGEGPGLDEI